MRSNVIIAIIFLLCSVLFPVITAIILFKYQHRLEESRFKHSIEAMYENVDVERKASLAYIIIFLIRRLLFSAVLVLMINYPLFQVLATYFLCLFNTIYIISVKPFKTATSNYSEIFNELCLLFGATHLFLYTDYMEG